MNTGFNSLTQRLLEWLNPRPRTREEPLDVLRVNHPGPSIWENAWVDCLVQACASTPWIIVSAVGRLLLQRHT
jgi:hypothetical protein